METHLRVRTYRKRDPGRVLMPVEAAADAPPQYVFDRMQPMHRSGILATAQAVTAMLMRRSNEETRGVVTPTDDVNTKGIRKSITVMPQRHKTPRKNRGSDKGHAWSIVRQALVTRRQELLERVRAVEKDLERESDPTSADWNERATQRSNDEVLSAIGHAGARELEAIDLALRRIELGTYGACSRCGKPIAVGRLHALPHVACCEICAD